VKPALVFNQINTYIFMHPSSNQAPNSCKAPITHRIPIKNQILKKNAQNAIIIFPRTLLKSKFLAQQLPIEYLHCNYKQTKNQEKKK